MAMSPQALKLRAALRWAGIDRPRGIHTLKYRDGQGGHYYGDAVWSGRLGPDMLHHLRTGRKVTLHNLGDNLYIVYSATPPETAQ